MLVTLFPIHVSQKRTDWGHLWAFVFNIEGPVFIVGLINLGLAKHREGQLRQFYFCMEPHDSVFSWDNSVGTLFVQPKWYIPECNFRYCVLSTEHVRRY